MFIENHVIKTHKDEEINLVFIKSLNVEAYPCGRRRGNTSIGTDPANTSTSKYIPFDPEARLNTEANNRKLSGLNGYTQTYLESWDEAEEGGRLKFSLAGYFFDIKLDSDYTEPTVFGQECEAKAGDGSAVYANILLQDVQLFAGSPKNYFTSILRNQSSGDELEPCIDLLSSNGDPKNTEHYYFSGLSFSTAPLTSVSSKYNGPKTRDSVPHIYETADTVPVSVTQQIVSLQILEKDQAGTWKIHEPARLPLIEHDTTQNSIVVGDTRIKRVENEGAVVDNYNGDLVVEHNTTVKNNLVVENTAEIANKLTIGTPDKGVVIDKDSATHVVSVTGDTTLNGKLEVIEDAIIKATLSVDKTITVGSLKNQNGNYTGQGLELSQDGTAVVSEALHVGNKITTKEIEAESITADSLYQKVNGTDMQVPIIELNSDASTGFYQLKITRIGAKSAN